MSIHTIYSGSQMSLDYLAETMGPGATEVQVQAMHDLLIANGHEGRDFCEIDDDEWHRLTDRAGAEVIRAKGERQRHGENTQ